MRILFLNLTERLNPKIKHPRHIHPPLDMGYCASLLESKGHKTFFIDFALKSFDTSFIKKFLIRNKIKIVVFKLSPCILKWGINFLKDIKEGLDIFLIGIGPTSTVLTSRLLFENSPVDFCIIGEPEISLLRLVEKIKRNEKINRLSGIAFFHKKLVINKKRSFINDLDNLPFPKHSFFINKGYTFFYPTGIFGEIKPGFIISSRGCPYTCSFCSPLERVSFGKSYRMRKPKKVVEEMEFLKKMGINFIYFEDDIFTFDKEHTKEICKEILKKKIKIKWGAQTRVDRVDYETLRWMKKAGCSTICFGIESGSTRILKMIKKNISLQKIKRSVKIANKLGIKTVGFFIIGNFGEKRKEIMKSLTLAKNLPLDMIQVHFFTPYPGSSIFRNFVSKVDVEKLNTQDFPTSLSNLSREELKRYQKYFYFSFYLTPRNFFKFFFRFLNFFNLKNELKLLKQTIIYWFF